MMTEQSSRKNSSSVIGCHDVMLPNRWGSKHDNKTGGLHSPKARLVWKWQSGSAKDPDQHSSPQQ